jgi:membrane-associated protease RseP (regulator of RpoE activity)
MKHLLRPYRRVEIVVALGICAGTVAIPVRAAAQSTQILELLQGTSPLLHSSSQGYLGVWVDDIDNDKAQALKLKEVRGAVITLIDHDAPAGQIGLRVNDVVLQLNGQNVEGAEQLRRMLKEIPPGRKVSLEFSRDGNVQTTSVELVDHRQMAHDVWNKLGTHSDTSSQTPGNGLLPGGGDAPLPGMFHMPIFGSTLNVGALVEPLTGQMADYFGVQNGLMVKQVAKKSEAATAGLKAFDVILKVGPDAITTLSDWDRALRSNQGKPVQVTVLRDKKQQTLTLQVDSKHKTSSLQMEELFPGGDCNMLAELAPDAALLFGEDSLARVEALADQAEQMKDKIQSMKPFQISPEQTEEFRKQAEELKNQLKLEPFKIDPQQQEELRKQMELFRENFKPDQFNFKADDFKIDPKQMDELREQMKQFRERLEPMSLEVRPN